MARALLRICVAALGLAGCQIFLVMDDQRDPIEAGSPIVVDAHASGEAGIDTSVPPPNDAGVLPAYCQGITAHYPLDTDLFAIARTSTMSLSAPSEVPEFRPARFGNGLLLANNIVGHVPATRADGGTIVTNAVGSMSFRIRLDNAVPCPNELSLARMESVASIEPAGPELLCTSTTFTFRNINQGLVPVGVTTGATVTAGEPVHFVMTWSQSARHLRFAVNGNFGQTVGDITPREPVLSRVRIGAPADAINGELDEVTLWDRELEPAEMATLHASTRPLAESCGL